MTPPLAGQVGFLEGLESIDAQQFARVLQKLQRPTAAPAPTAPATNPGAADAPAADAPTVATRMQHAAAAPGGLLLKDATLEDIVRFLHAKNIEPTFRFLTPQ
jgi:hypothetical protein